MNVGKICRAGVVLLAACLATGGCLSAQGVAGVPAATLDRKVDALLAQMTLEEKAGQLTQIPEGVMTGPGFQSADNDSMIRGGGVGSMLGIAGAEQTNRLQRIAVEQSRLHIPLVFGFDVIHGQHTIFPVPLGLAASFDPALIRETAHTAAQEARGDGIRWVFSPMVDIARDARWGRITESAGEDPFLGGVLAAAYVRGYQGAALTDADSVAACVKHFAAYGAVVAGRDYNTVDMSETQLRQVYLPPYRAAIDAGAATVMSSFNTLNGVPATANRMLLTDTLRGEWDFKGVVVSDWGAVEELVPHGVAADGRDAARMALRAGTDVDMSSDAYNRFLPQLVREGRVPVGEMDEAVRRVLRLKFAMGLFDHPYTPVTPASAENRKLARRAAEESFVLLKNDLAPVAEHTKTGAAMERFGSPKRPLLPLDAGAHQRIALIGPFADSKQQMLGSWIAAGNPNDAQTLRDTLSVRLGDTLTFVKGTEILPGTAGDAQAGFAAAVEAARKADVVIMALGEDGPLMTGEASSRTRLDLPGNQQALLEAVVAAGKPVVLVLFSGRPLALPWAAEHVAAIVEAWYPGVEAGPALAGILFGEAVPSGHLPVEFPYAVGQEPLFLAQLPTGRPVDGVDLSHAPEDGGARSHSRYLDEYNEPLFPFGWGLSYTSFGYGPVGVERDAKTSRLFVTVTVTNAGKLAADDVVQLYVRRRAAPLAQPVRELEGFERVSLTAGGSRLVRFALSEADLAYYDGSRRVEGADGDFDVWVGDSSAAEAHASFASAGGALRVSSLSARR